MPNRYRLKGSSLEEIRRKAELQYGPAARIVSAERVISQGIAGLFAGDRYEAMIEVLPKHEVVSGEVVPEPGVLAESGDAAPAGTAPVPAHDPGAAAPPSEKPAPDRAHDGAAAPGNAAPGAPPVAARGAAGPSHHLQGAAIAALLEQLGAGLRAPATAAPAQPAQRVEPEPGVRADPPARAEHGNGFQEPEPDAVTASGAAREAVPAPLTGVGDLVVLVGLGEDAMDTALAMSMAVGGADVRTAGELSAYGHLHVDGRQSATAARAHAVVTERTVLVAFGLGKARNALARVPSVTALGADQVWVVVDAGRKHEDTARWVRVLSAQLNISAVAVVGAGETATPESVNGLGLPVGWIDAGQDAPTKI